LNRNTTLAARSSTSSFEDLLREKYGVEVRRHRCDCPLCEGSSRLTMSVHEDFAHCFRCNVTIQARALMRESGIAVPQPTPEQIRERRQAAEFDVWKDTLDKILRRRFVRLTMRAEAAKKTLAILPEDETAWEELAVFYDAEAAFMRAFDLLVCEKVSRWLEQPMTKEKLRAAFDEACQRCGVSLQ
jgi:hypothetical protein